MDQIGTELIPLEASDFLGPSQSPEDKVVNQILYDMSFLLRDELQNPDLVNKIFAKASLTTHHEVKLFDLFQDNPILESSFSAGLAALAGKDPQDFYYKSYILERL